MPNKNARTAVATRLLAFGIPASATTCAGGKLHGWPQPLSYAIMFLPGQIDQVYHLPPGGVRAWYKHALDCFRR
jgi:hypothetical protein